MCAGGIWCGKKLIGVWKKKKIRKGSAGSMAAREEGGSRNGNQRRVKGKEKL